MLAAVRRFWDCAVIPPHPRDRLFVWQIGRFAAWNGAQFKDKDFADSSLSANRLDQQITSFFNQ